MTDEQTIPHPPDDLWHVMVDEIIDENDRLTARVADLEEHQTWLSALLKVALTQLQVHHRRLDDEREWAA